MADITKCTAVDCPIKERCYRYKALDNKYAQSYGHFVYDHQNKECAMYWDNY